jgi:hypothetical protein
LPLLRRVEILKLLLLLDFPSAFKVTLRIVVFAADHKRVDQENEKYGTEYNDIGVPIGARVDIICDHGLKLGVKTLRGILRAREVEGELELDQGRGKEKSL